MKERPIIFTAENVSAILDGHKTQTRRVIKPQPVPYAGGWRQNVGTCNTAESRWMPKHGPYPLMASCCPYGQPGDQLWVRQTWWHERGTDFENAAFEDGTLISKGRDGRQVFKIPNWKPEDSKHWHKRSSIHMPKWASRINLKVTAVRVEQLQNISEEDAQKEGILEPSPVHGKWCYPHKGRQGHWSYRKPFADLWNSINKNRGFPWNKNPWVWAIEFKREKGKTK